MSTDTPATPSAGADVGRLPEALERFFSTGNSDSATPRLIDMCFTVFMAANRPNDEDGGPSDWFNDTKPKADRLVGKMRDLFASALSAQAERPDAGRGLPGVEEPRLWHGQRSLADWAAEQAERLRAYFKHARYPAEKTLIGPVGLEEWKAGYATASDHLVVLDYLAAHPASSPPASGDRLREAEDDAKDAARYRWLRSRDVDQIHMGGVFAGQTPENLVLTEGDLDRAIDDMMALERIAATAPPAPSSSAED